MSKPTEYGSILTLGAFGGDQMPSFAKAQLAARVDGMAQFLGGRITSTRWIWNPGSPATDRPATAGVVFTIDEAPK